MISIEEYNTKLASFDFQRSNMFSVIIATEPGSVANKKINGLNQEVYSQPKQELERNKIGDVLGGFSGFGGGINGGQIEPELLTRISAAIGLLIDSGKKKILKKDGKALELIGAMSSRLGTSLLGDFDYGTSSIGFFRNTVTESTNKVTFNPSLNVYAVKLPNQSFSHEVDKMHNSPNIKITGRNLDPLTISMRVNPDASNYVAFVDWFNSVEDPVTQLRALPVEVEANIQVTLHDRVGDPHTVIIANGCIPVDVSAPELSYENDNQIAVFDVSFAYRHMSIGAVSKQTQEEVKEEEVPYESYTSEEAKGSWLSRADGYLGMAGLSTSSLITKGVDYVSTTLNRLI